MKLLVKDMDISSGGPLVVIVHEEDAEKYDPQPPLYTKEEKDQLYSIKKDIEKFPKHSDE